MAMNSTKHEIMSLFLGDISIKTGLHFWNLMKLNYSDSLTFFRESKKCSPRTLFYDIKGLEYQILSLNDENKIKNNNEENLNANETWNGKTSIVNLESGEPNLFSNFNGVNFHHKTINEYSEFKFREEFKEFDFGYDLMKNEKKDDFEDNLRYFMEECDHFQGFQVVVDVDSTFGGMGVEVLTQLNDEYSKSSILTFGVTPYSNRANKEREELRRIINQSLTFHELVPLTSIYVPLSSNGWNSETFRFGKFEQDNFHHGAIFANALSTLLSPCNSNPNGMRSLQNLKELLNLGENYNVCSLLAKFPIDFEDQTVIKELSSIPLSQNKYLYELTPNVSKRLKRNSTILGDDLVILGAPNSIKVDQYSLSDLLSNRSYSTRRSSCLIPPRMKLASPFPSIFYGNLKPFTGEISSLSYLTNTKGLKKYFGIIVEDWKKVEQIITLKRYSRQDLPEIKNHLLSYLDQYE